jgi:hypothetical protein
MRSGPARRIWFFPSRVFASPIRSHDSSRQTVLHRFECRDFPTSSERRDRLTGEFLRLSISLSIGRSPEFPGRIPVGFTTEAPYPSCRNDASILVGIRHRDEVRNDAIVEARIPQSDRRSICKIAHRKPCRISRLRQSGLAVQGRKPTGFRVFPWYPAMIVRRHRSRGAFPSVPSRDFVADASKRYGSDTLDSASIAQPAARNHRMPCNSTGHEAHLGRNDTGDIVFQRYVVDAVSCLPHKAKVTTKDLQLFSFPVKPTPLRSSSTA